ncbi:MAG: hypothetical protein ABI478_12005, partial [Propionivibrio sp.]
MSLHLIIRPIRRQIADAVENSDGKTRTSRFHMVPIVPARIEILVLGEFGFFEIVRPDFDTAEKHAGWKALWRK